jgi:hypothetical protein
MLGIVALLAGKRCSHSVGMLEIPMAPFTASIHKPRPLQITDQIANLSWHWRDLRACFCLNYSREGVGRKIA